MSHSAERGRFDWRALILLAWIVLIGARYTVMIVERKAPGLAGIVRTKVGW